MSYIKKLDKNGWQPFTNKKWQVKRAKFLLTPIDIRSNTGLEDLLTVSSERGVVPRETANVNMFKADSYVGYKLCWPEDLVINSLWSWSKGLGVSSYHGIVSSAYGVYRIKETSELDSEFLHHFLRSDAYQWEFQVRSRGIWRSRLQLTDSAFLDAPILLPPIHTQRQIATYLDKKTEAIDTLIAKKQKMIELLEEKRSALINHVVTKGLNPDAPMKDSGVPWIGEVPAHWEIKKLKHISPNITVGIVVEPSKHYVPDGVPCPRSLNVKELNIQHDNLVYISKESNETLSKSKIYKGDLISVRTGQPGTTAVVDEFFDGANCIDLLIVRRGDFNSNFLARCMNSEYVKSQYKQGGTGAIQTHFNVGTANNLTIIFPSQDEQHLLDRYLCNFDTKSLGLLDKLKTTITKLQEYRQALITAAVTGKIDVTRDPTSDDPEEAASGQGTLF